RNQNIWVVLLGYRDRLFDRIDGCGFNRLGENEEAGSNQQADSRGVETHFVYLLARAFLAPGMPLTVALISGLASWRDFAHIRRLYLQSFSRVTAGGRQLGKRPKLCLASNYSI